MNLQVMKRFSCDLCLKHLKGIHLRRLCSVQSDKSENPSPLKKQLKDVEELLNNSTPLETEQSNALQFGTTPYPKGTVFSQYSQSRKSLRPVRNPTDTSIILFPGQGCQYVGMGKNLMKYPVAEDMFRAASEILGYNLLKLCLEGPEEKLNMTEYCQPAVLVCSLAAVEKLKDENPKAINDCIATAGNSLGEISALVFAGAINFERAVRLVKVRAEAMQLCSEMTPSGMMTVLLGADSRLNDALRDARDHCSKLEVENPECSVANYLYPAAKVIAGHNQALEYVQKNAAQYKIRRTFRLPVSGAFHTQLMKPAADAIAAVLRKTIVNDPIISVHRNVDGNRYYNAESIIRYLPQQVYRPVKWEQIMHILYEREQDTDFPNTYECGPGRSLKTLLAKVNAKASRSAENIFA